MTDASSAIQVVAPATIFSVLPSSRMWLRLLDGHGIPGDEAYRYIG